MSHSRTIKQMLLSQGDGKSTEECITFGFSKTKLIRVSSFNTSRTKKKAKLTQRESELQEGDLLLKRRKSWWASHLSFEKSSEPAASKSTALCDLPSENPRLLARIQSLPLIRCIDDTPTQSHHTDSKGKRAMVSKALTRRHTDQQITIQK